MDNHIEIQAIKIVKKKKKRKQYKLQKKKTETLKK